MMIADHTSRQSVLTGIATSEVFISRSHGSNEVIQINGHAGETFLYEHNILDEESPVDFSGCELVMFIGCKTAASVEDGYNIAQAAVAAGAEYAIGFRESVAVSRGGEWAEYFTSYYFAGHSVHESIMYALQSMTDYGGLDSCRLVFGYTDITYSDIIN